MQNRKTKFLTAVLEVDDEIVMTQRIRMTIESIKNIQLAWYYRYALVNRRYKIYLNIPSKEADYQENYLTLNLQKLKFKTKPSNNDTTEQ